MSAAKCETGWGEGLSSRTVSQLRDHPTPPLRVDPPPPGEGKSRARSQLKHTSAFSRRNPPEFCNSHLALFRGRRECRAPGAPAAARVVVVNTRVSHHGHTGNARHSPRNGFTTYFVLSPVIGLSCHRHRRNCFHQLNASVEASGPHDFAVCFSAIRQRRYSIHRIPAPTSVTIAIRPSGGQEQRRNSHRSKAI
jgi:hypothetical protein